MDACLPQSERTATIQTLRKAPTSTTPTFNRDTITPHTITPTPIAAAHTAHPDSKPPISAPLDADVEAKERAQAEDNARLEKKMAEANLGETKPVGTEKHVRIGEGGAAGHEKGADEARKRSVELERAGSGMNKGFVKPGHAV